MTSWSVAWNGALAVTSATSSMKWNESLSWARFDRTDWTLTLISCDFGSSAYYTYARKNNGFPLCLLCTSCARFSCVLTRTVFLYGVAKSTYWRRAKPETFSFSEQIRQFSEHFSLKYNFSAVSHIIWVFCSFLLNLSFRGPACWCTPPVVYSMARWMLFVSSGDLAEFWLF